MCYVNYCFLYIYDFVLESGVIKTILVCYAIVYQVHI